MTELVEVFGLEIERQKDELRQEGIEIFRQMQADFPNQEISRDLFRKHCAEYDFSVSQYIDLWGDFTTYKRACGAAPSKATNAYNSSVAKHVSVEKLRKFNSERFKWKDAFSRDSLSREQVFLVGSDIHDLFCDPFYRRMFVEATRITHPDKIIFNGDLLDNPEFSKYSKRPSEYKVEDRLKWVFSFWHELRNIVPDAEFNMVEGNHEVRFIKSLIEENPGMLSILEARGENIQSILGLNDYEVNYFSSADISAFTNSDMQNEQKRNYYKFREHVLFHHFPVGASFGYPGISGHHHFHKVTPQFNLTFGSYSWHQSGGGSRRHVDYQTTMGEKWNNGFYIVRIDLEDPKNTVFEYVDTTRNRAVIQGQYFYRQGEEQLFYF